MNSLKKIYSFLLLTITILLPLNVLAICPICIITVGVGLGLSRWLGIDDTITGLWIGGLIMSLVIWTISFLDKKNIQFKGRKMLIFLGYYLFTVLPLYWSKIIGHPLNRLWGVDKLLLGIILGSIAFLLSVLRYFQLKKKNQNHAYFPFQKVIMPITPLIILSLIFYYLTK